MISTKEDMRLLPAWQAVRTALNTGSNEVHISTAEDRDRFREFLRTPEDSPVLVEDVIQAVAPNGGVGELKKFLTHTLMDDSSPVASKGPSPATLAANSPQKRREKAWKAVRNHPRVRDNAEFSAWVDTLVNIPLRGAAVSTVYADFEKALTVIDNFPGPEHPTPLAVFALNVLGDPHGLDSDQNQVSKMVLQLLLTRFDLRGHTFDVRREAFERVGILSDSVSSPVLAYNFTEASGVGSAAHQLRTAGLTGTPTQLTLQQVQDSAADQLVPCGTVVWVVENPTVLTTAAAKLGRKCPPIVCTQGSPSASTMVLLYQLAASGAKLVSHTDFDSAGLRITQLLVSKFGCEPVLMTSDIYHQHAASTVVPLSDGFDWDSATWDSTGLITAMRDTGKAVYEESMLDEILARMSADVREPSVTTEVANRLLLKFLNSGLL